MFPWERFAIGSRRERGRLTSPSLTCASSADIPISFRKLSANAESLNLISAAYIGGVSKLYGKSLEGIHYIEVKRSEMFHIAGKKRKASAGSDCGDGQVRETGGMAHGSCHVHEIASRACSDDIEWQHPVAVEMKYKFEPISDVSGLHSGSGSFHPGDSIANFGNGYRRQVQSVRVYVQPVDNGWWSFPGAWSANRKDIRVQQIHFDP